MIKLEKLGTFGMRKLVEIAYSGDKELLDKYWGDGFSLAEAVDETMRGIDSVSKEVEMDCYCVLNDDEEIGYVCKFTHNLYSFSININHRTKKNLIEFWEAIKQVMEESFICMLFPQNTRAIVWLEKCGMIRVDGVEQNCITLLKI